MKHFVTFTNVFGWTLEDMIIHFLQSGREGQFEYVVNFFNNSCSTPTNNESKRPLPIIIFEAHRADESC